MKRNKSKWLSLGLSLAVAAGSLFCGSAKASVIWEGNASNGTSSFNSSQPVNGTITVVTDSTYGKVWKIVCNDNGNTKARSELSGMKGFTPSNTGVYYFGWRQKWGPLPTKVGKWQVVSQVHLEGSASDGAPVPFGIQCPGDGNMHFQYENPSSVAHDFWIHSLPLNQWHSLVYHIQFNTSESKGWVEFWYDGSQQTLKNGSKRYPSAWAFPGCTSYWKWGVYRSGSGGAIGQSVAYLWRPRAGTAYADVAP